MRNGFLEKIQNNAKPIGLFVGSGSPVNVECIGRTGFDYIIADNEHSPIEAETSAELFRAAELSGLTPLARVREISRPAILKLLDVGARGLIVPNVKTPDEVRELVSYVKYYPVGNRGFCPSRKDGWGFDLEMSVADTMSHINANTLLIPQCETVEALNEIENIVSIEGVDGIFIGPFDLSISMGIPGEFSNPEFQSAMKHILDCCHHNGKFCMLFAGTRDAVADGFSKGFDSMTYSIDSILLIRALKSEIDAIRKTCG